ncbi:MAG TPA: ABC transporter permease [Candidatus Dormibacteraeota bacterium]
MSLRDGFVLALRSALRRPARTALTVVAVALGSALLVALAVISQVADTRVISQLGRGGPATAIDVAAAAPDPVSPGSDNPTLGPAKNLDDAALAAIRRLPHVTSALPIVSQPVVVVPPPRGPAIPTLAGDDPDRGLPRPFTTTAVGIDLGAVRDLPVTLLAGRLPAGGSTVEVAVTLDYLDRLHLDLRRPQAVLGTEVEIGAPQVPAQPPAQNRARWSRAAITGVVAQQVGGGTLLTSLTLARTERAWQLAGVDGRSLGLPLPVSEYASIVVVADSLGSVHAVRAAISGLGYSTSAPEQLVATVQRYLHVVDVVLGAIGLIALLIAALGITNALLAAVRERRPEIGVLKAIGARDSDVLRWFLTEALICGVAGGLLGALGGLAAVALTAAAVNGYLVQQGLEGVDLGGAPWTTGLAGVAGSAVLALLAAAWPALRAARLPARDAMATT